MPESKSTGKALTARKRAADDRAAISLGCNLRSARAAGGHHGKNTADHYRPESQPNHAYVVNCKTSTGLWKSLFNAKGEGTVSAPDGRARCHEGAAAQGRPDDGSGLPWGGKGEMLTQVERISKKTILAAGLRPELTFTSLGRHGGATEANTSGRTETQLMTKGQWSSTAAMGNYLHDDDEGKQDAQMKRMKRRAK
jgi:hypothetical protein